MTEPILKDRAQKYGRNTLFTAGAILVLAHVQAASIENFHPFGFEFVAEVDPRFYEFAPATDAQFYVWCFLAFGLFYYFVRFLVEVSADYYGADGMTIRALQIRRDRKTAYDLAMTSQPEKDHEAAKKNISAALPHVIHLGQFYVLDVLVPMIAAFFAAWAVCGKIIMHWPLTAIELCELWGCI